MMGYMLVCISVFYELVIVVDYSLNRTPGSSFACLGNSWVDSSLMCDILLTPDITEQDVHSLSKKEATSVRVS